MIKSFIGIGFDMGDDQGWMEGREFPLKISPIGIRSGPQYIRE